jgi:hypothetical protein
MPARLAAALALLFAFAAPGFAQQAPACSSLADLVGMITGERYKEARVGGGTTTQGVSIEFYANASTGTWTILSVDSSGVNACIAGAGGKWHAGPAGDPA